MLPGGAAGRIDESAGRDQIAEAAAGAAVPSGTERKIVTHKGERERRHARRERYTVEIGRLRAEADIGFDAGDPAGRKLPVVAGMQPELRGDAVERIGGGAGREVDRSAGEGRRRRGQVRARRAEAGVETGIEAGPRDRRRGGGGAGFDEHRRGVAIRQGCGRAEFVGEAQREQAVVQMDAIGRRVSDQDRRYHCQRNHLGPGGGERLVVRVAIFGAPHPVGCELHLHPTADRGAGPIRRGGERERREVAQGAVAGDRRAACERRLLMLPGEAAGRIDQSGRRDQKAETQPGAGIPRGSQAEIGPAREPHDPSAEEAEARELPGVAGPTEVAFDPGQPARRELPIVAEIAAEPSRLHVEWCLGHEYRVQARHGPGRNAGNDQLLDEIRRGPFGIGGAQPGIGAHIKAGPTGNGRRGRNRRRLDR